MNLVFGRDAEVAEWVDARIDISGDGFGPCSAIGVATDRLIAGVVYHDYQPGFQSCQMSMAADVPTWARRDIIAGLLAYPFAQLGCWMVAALCQTENDLACRTNEHIGFKRKTIIPHAFGPKRHAVLFQMTLPEYERLYHGQEKPQHSRAA